MPKSAERKIKSQGGVSKYRTVKKGDTTLTCAVTKKKGQRGGRSVCWENK